MTDTKLMTAPSLIHTANVFLPGSIGPVKREVVLVEDHQELVDRFAEMQRQHDLIKAQLDRVAGIVGWDNEREEAGETIISCVVEVKNACAGLQAAWEQECEQVDQLKSENEQLSKDAGRWQAFINCGRIRFFGWAGYDEKDPYGNSPGNYRHFGGEFWTIHSAPTADKEKAVEILNGFADAAVAALGKGEQP